MKKILISLVISLFAFPAFGACPITGGACTVDYDTPLQQRFAPNRLQDIHRTDAFQPKYVTPYQDMLINTDEPTNYNSNCQFGVCLPENNSSQILT